MSSHQEPLLAMEVSTKGDELALLHYLLSPIHYLPKELIVNVDCLALNYFFNSTLSCESFVPLRAAFDHLYQLSGCNQIV